MLHSSVMDGPELLDLLLKSRKLTPNALADLLRKRSLQSQMQRYLARETRAPRPSTLQPIAKYFGIGVEAFYQPTIAKEIAERLHLADSPTTSESASETLTEREKYATYASPPTPIRPRQPLDLAELVTQIGRALEPFDESARKAVASLLNDVALNPQNASVTGRRIAALLAIPGKDTQGRSTASL